jgi:hypothetical protein
MADPDYARIGFFGGGDMAQLSTRGAFYLTVAFAVGSSIAAGTAPARAEFNLAGTWHVLIHYKDQASANPDQPRWDDRLWSFEPSGSRLRWTEWPLVVFSDDSGRFERRRGQYGRVLHYWEPDQGQLANIRSGLAANDRGSKQKTLRQDGDGWRSAGGARARSAMTITYQENWIVEDASGLPVFIREDMFGPAGAENIEGRTEYRTQEILEGGNLLVGTFERDGTRHGTFRMMRAGERKQLEAKSEKELQERGLRRLAISSGLAREELRESIGKTLEARGLSVDSAQLEELVDEGLRLYEAGVRESDIGEQLIQKAIREAGDAP